jgi:tripeptide aminopeptidase
MEHNLNSMKHTALERFLKYVTIDTQSDPNSPTCPSTEKQKDLGKLLVEEMLALGIKDAEMDSNGYVYGTIESNTEKETPTIFFCSHMDTSPDSSGTNVKPIVHQNYRGESITLPLDNAIVLSPKEFPYLLNQIGNDIVTASGDTLLGADNKSGVAAIMSAAQILIDNNNIKHGKIKLFFTPDEEIGRGVDKADLKKLNADFGYTLDGGKLGAIEDENFSADGAVLTIKGVSAHPGYAKGKMESAIKIASEIIAKLPKELSPEGTYGRDGFVHPVHISGGIEETKVQFIIRDFVTENLKAHADGIEIITKAILKNYPNSTYTLEVKEQYRNMKMVLDKHPDVLNYAITAIEKAGILPLRTGMRGGTDGARLSFMGLPCPNIFVGEQAFHSKFEWVSKQDMEKATEVIINICELWAN